MLCVVSAAKPFYGLAAFVSGEQPANLRRLQENGS
jgi:hypothetical protein